MVPYSYFPVSKSSGLLRHMELAPMNRDAASTSENMIIQRKYGFSVLFRRLGAALNRRTSSKLLAVALMAASLLVAFSAFAQDSSFHRTYLAYGISLDIPSHWMVLSLDGQKNITSYRQAIIDNSGIEIPAGRKESLLVVNSAPYPPRATIRVSVTSPSSYTQSFLAGATKRDLKNISDEVFIFFKRSEASGGPRVMEMQSPHVEYINNHRTLVLSYVRAGMDGPSPWQVRQYIIPVSGGSIQITLSHRQSDAALLAPILERVKRSVVF